MSKRFGKNDRIFLTLIIILSCVMIVLFYVSHSTKGNRVTVTVDGELFGEYSLSQKQSIEITNKAGAVCNYLIIEDGHADMIDADCPDRLCVKQKNISLDRETIVCLPNKVVVEVISTNESDVDAVAK